MAGRCQQLFTDVRVVLHQGHQGIELKIRRAVRAVGTEIHRRSGEIEIVVAVADVEGTDPLIGGRVSAMARLKRGADRRRFRKGPL